MFRYLYEYQEFYKTSEGRLINKILKKEIFKFVDKRQPVLNIGYSLPYFRKDLSVISSSIDLDGDYDLPSHVSYAHTHKLPVESGSYEQVSAVHMLENASHPIDSLKESWRVLKGGGKLVMVVSNRGGLWSRTDRSPFGNGRPFSAKQVVALLEMAGFVCEDIHPALFLFPAKNRTLLRASRLFQRIGKYFMVFPGGVHIVVAQKQLYSPVTPSKGTAVPVTEGIKKVLKPNVASAHRNNKDVV